jgi:hypothetical protein
VLPFSKTEERFLLWELMSGFNLGTEEWFLLWKQRGEFIHLEQRSDFLHWEQRSSFYFGN